MESSMNRAILLARMAQQRADWEALLAEIGPARMEIPGVTDNWTFKDVVAHMTAWQQRGVARLQAARRDEKPAPAPWMHLPELNDDTINAWIYEQNRDQPLDAVLSESRATMAQLEAAVGELSDEELTDPARFPWLGDASLGEMLLGNSIDHFYDDHLPPLRAWLNKQ